MTEYSDPEENEEVSQWNGYTDDDDDSGMAIASSQAANLLSHEYDAEELTYLGTLKESEAAERLRMHIRASPLLAGAQNALTKIVDTYICRDVILAHIENPASALNDIDIAFSHAILSATTYDTRKPDWLMNQCLIRSTVDILLTRTRGAKRERILQDTQRVEVITGKLSSASQNAQPKRSLGLPWK